MNALFFLALTLDNSGDTYFFSIWSKNSAGYQRRGRRGNEVGSFQLKFEVDKKKKKKKKPKRIKKKKK